MSERGLERHGAVVNGSSDVSILGVSNALLRNWRVLALCVLIGAAVAAAVTLIPPPRYVAQSSFIAQDEEQGNGALAGFAAQLGVNVGAAGGGPSIDFYAQLLRSRSILTQVVTQPLPVASATASDTMQAIQVPAYLGVGDRPTAEQTRRAVRRLRKDVSVTVDPKIELATLRTWARSPEVAEAINARLLTLLDHFNQSTRQSQASAERRFAESRLEEARRELRAAENALQNFYARNQRFRESSQLSFEAGRLEREVQQRQEVYVSLAQAYEQARIEEVRNTPVITVVESPAGSAIRRRGLIRNGILGVLVGAVVGLGFVFLREAIAYDRRRNPQEYDEFLRLRQLAGLRLRRLPVAALTRQTRQ